MENIVEPDEFSEELESIDALIDAEEEDNNQVEEERDNDQIGGLFQLRKCMNYKKSSPRILLLFATCTYSADLCWAVHNNLLRQN